MSTTQPYGTGDASYQAAGGLDGLIRLADQFYYNMDSQPGAAELRAMHPRDLSESSRKLAFFLSGWLGGPRLFREHYGEIRLPQAHKHFPVTRNSTEAWLSCMQLALEQLGYPEDFREYLLRQLRVPAERILTVANQNT